MWTTIQNVKERRAYREAREMRANASKAEIGRELETKKSSA